MTTDVPDEDATTRQMRRAARLTATVALAPVSTLGVVLTSATWWEAVIVAAGNLVALGVLDQWSLERYPARARRALVFCLAAWALCAVTASTPLGFFAAAVVGGMLLARSARRRLLRACGFAASMAALGSAVLLNHPPALERVLLFVVVPALGTLLVGGVIVVSEQSWLLVQRISRAKEVEAELVLARERARLADDLHDIQGHTLHVIKVKAVLAQRLARSAPGRAEAELADIRRLVDDTVATTRDLVLARHEINLDAEIENARHLCEAAGIDVTLDRGASRGDAHPLLAHVLREATTNLLRHATATSIWVSVSASHVTVRNDGSPRDQDHRLRGLARLRDRIAGEGGDLSVDQTDDLFTVSARLPSTSGQTETT